ncbi:MAG: hypothetical protein LBS16_03920 [Prevotellaceae bacterium]|nr:hypothetical protein [Prevotellaceae bacterium]
MNNNLFKKSLPHIAAVALFLGLTVAYFSPIVFENKDLMQGDIKSSRGWGNDLREYHKQTGDYAFWSNSMFSGMPANYTYMPPTTNVFRIFGKIFTFCLPTNHIGILFIYLLGFYIFMLSLRCKPWLSIVGAVAYAFASYNLIIIDAGHASKGLVMATMAPVLGGIILCFKKKYLIGALVTLLFTGINILWGHQQISYYLILMIAILAIVYLIYAVIQRTLKTYLTAVAVLLPVALLSIAPSLGSLIPTMDYAKDTMRGGAVLQADASGKTKSGLDIDYAYQWSYDKMESMTLLIPNFYGGSSHYNIGQDSRTYDFLIHEDVQARQAAQFTRHAPMYWGTQPFTSGPVYAGAIICLLFVLGLIIVKKPERWWILAVVIVSLILSWGRNFMAVNEFLFHHLPLYNKFRTPSTALIMANTGMATLAVLALKEIVNASGEARKRLLKPLLVATGITGGICLFFALFGSALFNFSASVDANFPEWLQTALVADRKHMLASDAWRSTAFIALAAGIIWFYLSKVWKTSYVVAALGILILCDLWTVDRRFLGEDNFISGKKAKEFVASDIDKHILQDKDPDYRVLNRLTENTFNESETSYFHKSVGGYSPAKLRRYQDIIDYYLSSSINMNVVNMLNTRYIMNVVNMLNTRYIIYSTEQGARVHKNVQAMGNVWFVENIHWVDTPDEEIKALAEIDVRTTAVIDARWRQKITLPNTVANDAGADIQLTNYVNPGNLVYESNSSEARLAVFSEVYYKTWKAFVDDVETPVIQVNYILRGIQIPAGSHKIEFKCVDEVYQSSARISLVASIVVGVVIVVLLGMIIFGLIKTSKTKDGTSL